MTIGVNMRLSDRETWRVDLGKNALWTLKPETVSALRRRKDPLKLTYYVTPRRRMPSSMKNLEKNVTSVLKEMRRRANGNVSFSVVDPTENKELALELARKRISSANVKKVDRDEIAVYTVWSGLLVETKSEFRSIGFVGNDQLSNLEKRILDLAKNIDEKRTVEIAFSGPPIMPVFKTALAAQSHLTEIDLNTQPIPAKADLLILVQPSFTKESADKARRFLESGKNVFLFANAVHPRISVRNGYARGVTIVEDPVNADPFLGPMGIELKKELVMADEHSGEEPYLLLLRPTWFDLSRFRLKRIGRMLAPVCTPIVLHDEKMSAAGFTAEVFSHTSAGSWLLPADGRAYTPREFLAPAPSDQRRKMNVGVIVQNEKSWKGRLFIYGSQYLFSDSALSANPPNTLFLKNFIMTFTDLSQLTATDTIEEPAHPLTSLTREQKILWRAGIVFFVPGALFLVLLLRLAWPERRRLASVTQTKLTAAPCFLMPAALLAFLFYLPAGRARWDVSEGKTHTPPDSVKKLLDRIDSKFSIEYFTSPAEEMSEEGKKLISNMAEALKDLKTAAGAKMSFRISTIDKEKAKQKQTLELLKAEKISPFPMRIIEADSYREVPVLSAISVHDGTAGETISPLLPANASKVNFLLAAALQRLVDKRRIKVALLSEYHALAPSEAFTDYFQQQLAVPEAADVYSELRAVLSSYGYDVETVDAKSTAPIDADLLIYVQPFVITDNIRNEIKRHLRAGQNVILAAQHFNVQQRQYSARAFETVYWPQPQFTRVNEFLSEFGIELKREILFDKNKKDTRLKTQVRWGVNMLDQVSQSVALPFLIRTVSDNYNHDSVITRNLSDMLFTSGNRWIKIAGKFPASLQWTDLITTSAQAWALDWQGGWLPKKILEEGVYFEKKQPLAVLVKGIFPSGTKESQLLLVGCSQMLMNDRLYDKDLSTKDFIMNAVVAMTQSAELADIHARSESLRRGFNYVPPKIKYAYRGIVMFLAPALFCLYGLYRRLMWSRNSFMSSQTAFFKS